MTVAPPAYQCCCRCSCNLHSVSRTFFGRLLSALQCSATQFHVSAVCEEIHCLVLVLRFPLFACALVIDDLVGLTAVFCVLALPGFAVLPVVAALLAGVAAAVAALATHQFDSK